MTNPEIAGALEELATLYELDGAVKYRVIAYREAARVVRDSPVSVAELAAQRRLTELPGVGETLAEKISTLLETGEIPAAARLKKKFPPSLIAVTRIPGLGAKTARRLYDELGIATIEQLEEAARSQRLRELKGLGPRAEENVLAAIERLSEEGAPGRLLLSKVLPTAERLAEDLAAHPASDRVGIAGSVRRWAETCKDIDIIATADDPQALADALTSNPLVAQAGSGGESGARIVTHTGIAVDLRIAPPACFANLLQHLTGSAEHNVQLRERAVKMGLSVSEHGINADGDVIRCSSEAELYERLGLAFIEPELREGRGEIAAAAAGELPALVALDDVRGDLHCHTTLSDGRNSLDEMAAAARARGYGYLALTDHSATHGFDNHVTSEELWERVGEVREWNEQQAPRGFRLLAGSEVNVMPDGGLDYPDDLLEELDWVLASVHTSFRMGEERMTDRVLTAIENPLVDCIGHLTGRLILRREPYGVDIERIAEAAARTGTMLEINGNPNRRDLSEHHARLAAEAGALIVLNTDAHGTDTLSNMRYAVATARRAWLRADQVANTRTWRDLARIRAKRLRATKAGAG